MLSATLAHKAHRLLGWRHAAAQAYAHRAQTRRQGRVRRHQARAAAGGPASSSSAAGQAAAVAALHSTRQEAYSSTANRPAEVMEVEVKLRLAGAEAHAKLAKALQASYRITHEQENFFFDGSKQELSSQRVVLRVRFYGIDKKAVITLKGRQVLKDGIGRAPEEEEGVDPLQARVFLTDPSRLLHLDIPLMAKLRESYPSMEGLVSLGGFKNTRQEFDWQEHLLELDETKYEWGTLYELECETTEPEKLRQELEAFLGEQGVAYKYSTTTKFANFRNRTLE